MGARLTEGDERTHPVGEAANWNESRYIDFWDPIQRVGGWMRIGNRPNEGYAEMSVCVNLPDGRNAFYFTRASIDGNGLEAGGQSWDIVEPWLTTRIAYRGDVLLLEDPWILVDPRRAFTDSPRAAADIDLVCVTAGPDTVMGADQDHIELIFLPGQADFHYQHLVHTKGTVRVGDQRWAVEGIGGKDHSWGPRNWHAKIYLRWLIAGTDAENGFMLVRAVGPTKQTRSGFVVTDGEFQVVEGFEMRNTYAGAPHYELERADVVIRAGGRTLSATGTPQTWVPLRHRQPGADGREVILRIVKSPAEWTIDGRRASGMLEYHDRLSADGVPAGMDD